MVDPMTLYYFYVGLLLIGLIISYHMLQSRYALYWVFLLMICSFFIEMKAEQSYEESSGQNFPSVPCEFYSEQSITSVGDASDLLTCRLKELIRGTRK